MASWVKVRRLFWKSSQEKRFAKLLNVSQQMMAVNPEAMAKFANAIGAFGKGEGDKEGYSVTVQMGGFPEELFREWMEALHDYSCKPPVACEFISALLCKPSLRAKYIDDRAEIYRGDYDRWGEAKADWIYRVDTLKSLLPMLIRFAGSFGLLQVARHWLVRWFT